MSEDEGRTWSRVDGFGTPLNTTALRVERQPPGIWAGRDTGSDAVIGRLSFDGQRLTFSTYLGGVRDDWLSAMAMTADDRVCVAGRTNSENFPAVNPIQPRLAGEADVFFSCVRVMREGLAAHGPSGRAAQAPPWDEPALTIAIISSGLAGLP